MRHLLTRRMRRVTGACMHAPAHKANLPDLRLKPRDLDDQTDQVAHVAVTPREIGLPDGLCGACEQRA
jgi:hypothetical protein